MCMQDKVAAQYGEQAGHLFAMVLAMADATHTLAKVVMTHPERSQIEGDARHAHHDSMAKMLSHAAVGMGIDREVIKKVMDLSTTVIRSDIDERIAEARGEQA